MLLGRTPPWTTLRTSLHPLIAPLPLASGSLTGSVGRVPLSRTLSPDAAGVIGSGIKWPSRVRVWFSGLGFVEESFLLGARRPTSRTCQEPPLTGASSQPCASACYLPVPPRQGTGRLSRVFNLARQRAGCRTRKMNGSYPHLAPAPLWTMLLFPMFAPGP